ncbi:MAG: hypothetical protein IJ291_03880 [Lachnospiraceae bacterium]|nr:hypothetical protein [Lachnospiraceae bacterium]
MKKKTGLILMAVAVIFIIAVVTIALRYNVYPYLFCGPNHPNRNDQNFFVCEDLDGNEVGTVCMDIRLSRFSRYHKGDIYEVEDYYDFFEYGNYLTDKKGAELSMMAHQLQGSYIADSGVMESQYSYVVLKDPFYGSRYDIYVDLGECYWYLYFYDAETAREFYKTSEVTVTYTGEDASEEKTVKVW